MKDDFHEQKSMYHQSWLELRQEHWTTPAAIFALAAFARCVVWVTGSTLTTSDYDDYREHGAELFSTGIISDPHIMPGYAALTQIFGENTGVIILDIGLSSLTCILVWWLANHIFNNPLAGIVSAIGTALHPNLVLTAPSGLTEPSFTFFYLAALELLYSEKYFIGSVIFILSVLIRPSFDILAPVLIFVFATFTNKGNWMNGLCKVGIYGVCYLVLMTPWWIHNINQYDEFVRLNLADGHVLYLGNNPHALTGAGAANDISPNDPLLKIASPLNQNKAMKQAALTFILEQPKRFFELSTIRFMRFWHIEDGSNVTVYLFIHPFTCIFLGFLLFGFKGRWRETLPLVLCVAYLTIVHTILISTPRYQLPVAPVVILLGTAWLTTLMFSTISDKRSK